MPIGVNIVDKYNPDPTIKQYNKALYVINWNAPNVESLAIPIGMWRFLQNPIALFGANWTKYFQQWSKIAAFANEPDIEGTYPSWYLTAYHQWSVAGGLVVEPAWHDERKYKWDGALYDIVSWHCYAGDFANRDSVLKRANGKPVIGTEYDNPGKQRQCAIDLRGIPEQVYLFAWEWPIANPSAQYTLRGLTLEKAEESMAGNVLIQAGHVNIESNCDAGLRGETGATHGTDDNAEREMNDYVAKRVVALLMDGGVGAQYVDANYNCSPNVSSNYAAVVALHCQSNPPDAGGWDVGVGNPATDGASAQSSALMQRISEQYEAATGLNRQQWCQSNPNVQEYYLFNALSKGTPFALIEMCNADVEWDWAHTADHLDRMAYGVANGVLAFLGKEALPIPTNAAPQAPQTTAKQDVLDAITDVSSAVSTLQSALTALREAVAGL